MREGFVVMEKEEKKLLGRCCDFLWDLFWISITGASAYLLSLWLWFRWFKDRYCHLKILESCYPLAGYALGFLFLSLAAGLIGFLVKKLKVQRIHRQASYVFFLYWGGVVLGAIFLPLYAKSLLSPARSGYLLLGLGLYFLFFFIVYRVWPTKKRNSFPRFSPGAVGLDDDSLGFGGSVKSFADRLVQETKNEKEYLSAFSLYGGLGSGKSSYTRMLVESLEKNPEFGGGRFLYTYISLTETNAAKDFSELFSERWVETLAERYPFILVKNVSAILRNIFREPHSNLFSAFLSFLSEHNLRLRRTKAKVWDWEMKCKPRFVSKNVGSIFMNIPEVREDLWLIVVDEIERAQLDEVYRLVEAIERFRYEGRTGLPLKIVFLLCISRADFLQLLEDFSALDLKTVLLKKFFFEDAKSLTNTLYLPPASYEKKRDFVWDRIRNFFQSSGIDGKRVGFQDCTPSLLHNPTREFLQDPREALGYILARLMECSPRIVNRTLGEVGLFYSTYHGDQEQKDFIESIEFCDVLALSFIRVRYPYLIEFFLATLKYIVEKNWDYQNQLIEKQTTLWDWISDVIGPLKISETEKTNVEPLVYLVAHGWIDYLGQSSLSTGDRPSSYYKRTSDAFLMRDYLFLVKGEGSVFQRNEEIFSKHKDAEYDFSSLSNEELYEYSRFVYKKPDLDASKYFDLAKELSRRLQEKQIPIQPSKLQPTLYGEFVTQFSFQVIKVAENISAEDSSAGFQFEQLFECWESVLRSPNVTTGGKFSILNSYFNFRGSHSVGIHLRLQRVSERFEKAFGKERLAQVVEAVFQERNARYFEGDQILYECEENFLFVLYQGWSGEPDKDKEKDKDKEINKIREAAQRGLQARPQVLDLYWREYPTAKEIKEGKTFHKKGTELYLPLQKLIELTEASAEVDEYSKECADFWKQERNQDFAKKQFELKENRNTLCAILKQEGYLK